jgi:hypothetical protein
MAGKSDNEVSKRHSKVESEVAKCYLLWHTRQDSSTVKCDSVLYTTQGLWFVGPFIFTHSNQSTNQMKQLITGLLLVVLIPLNMFRASLYPSSGAHQLQ